MKLTLDDLKQSTQGIWLYPPNSPSLDIQKYSSDSRQDCQNALFFAFSGDNFNAHDHLEKVLEQKPLALVVSEERECLKTAQFPVLLVPDVIAAYQQVATTLMAAHPSVSIALTGSSGKTSLKSVISQSLESFFPGHVLSTTDNTNNHIGVPQNIFRLKEDDYFSVLELGTNNPGEISTISAIAQPDIAILNNVGYSHIGQFEDYSALLKEKLSIFDHLQEDSVIIILDELYPCLSETLKEKYQIITYGFGPQADIRVEYLKGDLKGSQFKLHWQNFKYSINVTSTLCGEHQALNCGAMAALAQILDLDLDEFAASLKNIQLPGFRMKVEEIKDTTWVNDAYNANPQSSEAAVKWFAEVCKSDKPKRAYAILGDMLELGDQSDELHRELLDYANSFNNEFTTITVGQHFVDRPENHYAKVEDLIQDFLPEIAPGDLVLIKASRGMQLEQVIKKFKEQ